MPMSAAEEKEESQQGEGLNEAELLKSPIPLYNLLPAAVRRRIKALKKIQYQTLQLEAKFFQDVHKTECRFMGMFSQLFQKREAIVKGSVEPTDEDCYYEEGYESPKEEEPIIRELRSRLTITKLIEEGATGIPEFWLTVFKNIDVLSDLIHPHDEPILRHLTDIRVILNEEEPMGFKLAFHFLPNPYFSNAVLTKEYDMNCAPDDKLPWHFEGPEIVRSRGCVINWQKGMNVTVKHVQKRQRHKSKSSVRTVVKTVQNASFFNFFSPPDHPGEADAYVDGDTQDLLDTDYEIGHLIREKVVPNAVLYYTGEALDDESSDESSSEESETEAEEKESQAEDDEECRAASKTDESGEATSEVE